MKSAIKAGLKGVIPQSVLDSGKRILASPKLSRASLALASAPDEPKWLDISALPGLMKEYPVRQSWEEASTSEVAFTEVPDHRRAADVVSRFVSGTKRVLEIGGGPGGVSWAVAERGYDVTCLDLMDPLFPMAAAAGVKGFNGDACKLPFEDSSFDACWSLNAYEHIHSPPTALAEAWRVLRPGGRFYLSFAPIYNAPLGLHAFFVIGVPYCQHLWSEEQLRPHVTAKDFWHLNYWSLAQYRKTWADFSARMKPVSYYEGHDYHGIELISRFPSCFAKRSRSIEEFTVSKFVIVFEAVK